MKTLLRSLVSIALLATASPLWSADVSINSLPAIGSVSSSTVLPVVDVSGTPTTKKATVTQLINGLPVATGSTVGTMSAADKAKLDAATDANTASAIVRRDASGNFTAGTITAGTVTGLANPTNGSDAANKSYVDASAAGLTVKQAGRAATTANVTLSGGAPSTLDGVTLAASDRILVKNQADQTQNGIYYVATLGSGSNGTWARTTDADTGAELATGTYIFISSGTANANAAYTMVTQGTITLGTSNIVWALFSQVTSIAASSITGQLIESQIQDAAINTAKFAAGLTPVEILGTLPLTGNFPGRQVFLTTNSKLYRYNGSAFTAQTPTSDLSGSIEYGQIAANAVRVNELNADAVVAGKIGAGAVNTREIFSGAVNTEQLHAGAVTAEKITVANFTAMAGNIIDLTAGTIRANASVSVASGLGAVLINSSGLTIGAGRISMAGDGANPWIRVFGVSGQSGSRIELNGSNGTTPATLYGINNAGSSIVTLNGFGITVNAGVLNVNSGSTATIASGANLNIAGGAYLNMASTGYINMASGSAIAVGGGADVTFNTGSTLNLVGTTVTAASGTTINGPGSINLNAATGNPVNIVTSYTATAGTFQGYLTVKINGLTKLIPYYDPP